MTELHIASLSNWTPDLGATVVSEGGVRFRVWAPNAGRVDVELYGPSGVRHYDMEPADEDGAFVGLVPDARAGDRYRFRLNGDASFPDPCSRSQPEGPHGPSAIVDPGAFVWTDGAWTGLTMDGLVIYECHVGTFTTAGTFDAMIERLPELRALGVTAIELMPVAEFPGSHGWGYDGVNLFAPHHAYGGPDGLRRLVDAAHAAEIGVILDVVYNHLGPDGNYLRAYAPDYFTDEFHTPWGEALNFGGDNSHRVRELILTNIWRWMREFHIDGLRLDAVHAMHDRSGWHILGEIAARARTAAHPRSAVVIAEDDRNDVKLLRSPEDDGYGLDAVWADDFHHAVRVCITGDRQGYFGDFEGTAPEIARTIQGGFLYQGQHSRRRDHPRGTPVTDEPASAFVYCIQNHDQVGNRAMGERLATLVDAGAYRVASALLLLVPETPMLFMGQEFGATTPFLYFTDHEPELGRSVTAGRRNEFAGFSAFSDPAMRAQIPDPQAESTYLRSKLDWHERQRNQETLALYTDLLALRHDDPVLREPDRIHLQASAPAAGVVALHRWRDEGQRLVLANFGGPTTVVVNEALAAETPPVAWRLEWHTGSTRYGGDGRSPTLDDGVMHLP
ncbi:MAG: malto-oligosyltrehalose trehalohydrolase, partial [Dehalococcoidia bacterium]